MGRRKRKGHPVLGWVVLDKPAGLGSTPAVGKVRRIFDAQKAGHGGTLDPFATGLWPIALGEATKTVAFVMDGFKSYRFTIRWGVTTDTLDPEGEVTERSDHRPSEADIRAALPNFIGDIQQKPPAYSAIKVNGERAYDLARDGETVDLPPRLVEIDDCRLIAMPDVDHAVVECDCGRGTYVRSLARDLARDLGTVGMVTELRRTAVGPFTEDDAISLDALEETGHNPPDLAQYLLPIEAALDGIPAMALSEAEAMRFRNGQPVSLLRKMDLDRIADLEDGDEVLATHDGRAVALASYGKGEIRPVRVFNQ